MQRLENKRQTNTGYRVTEDMKKRLKILAANEGLSVTAIIDQALDARLKQPDKSAQLPQKNLDSQLTVIEDTVHRDAILGQPDSNSATGDFPTVNWEAILRIVLERCGEAQQGIAKRLLVNFAQGVAKADERKQFQAIYNHLVSNNNERQNSKAGGEEATGDSDVDGMDDGAKRSKGRVKKRGHG